MVFAMKICVILPTYNEKENIGKLIELILIEFKKIRHDMHILVVDDKSPDGTGEVVKTYQKKYKNIHLLYGIKKGLGVAYMRGFKETMHSYDVIIMMDADLQHPPNLLPQFIKQIELGYDFVIGSRYISGGATPEWNWKRKAMSRGGNYFARIVAGLWQVHDCTSGYRAIRTSVLRKIEFKYLATKGYAFISTVLYECIEKGAKVKEIPLVFRDRKNGETKLQKKDMKEFIINALRLRLKSENRFAKFAVIGFAGIIVNTLFLWYLYAIVLWPLLLAGAVAIELTIIFNFLFNDIFTFGNNIKQDFLLKRMIKFNLVGGYGFAINLIVLYVMARWFFMHILIANLIGIMLATLMNYIIVKNWTWRV